VFSKIRPRLTYANVVATLCLFLILGGGAYAANEWNGSNIQDGTLTGADIQDLSLGLPDYGANSISTGKLKDGDVRTQDLRDLGVTNSKIAWDSVSSGKVINNNLTGDDINEATLTGVDGSTLNGKSAKDIVMWANIRADGTVENGDATGARRFSAGVYTVTFPRNVGECAAVASNGPTFLGDGGTWHPWSVGSIEVYDSHILRVSFSFDNPVTGFWEAADTDFHIVVTC
jgi:hypothetical protein